MTTVLCALFCSLLLWGIHFGFVGSFHRGLINYDDLLFIEPMTKLSLSRYFTFWVKNPHGYAHPVRDFTWMFDSWLQHTTGLPSYWISQFFLFLILGWCVWKFLSFYLPEKRSLSFCLLLIFLTHPTLVEILQWASSRRNLLPLLFLFPPSLYILRSEREHTVLSRREWTVIIGLWLLSLLSYPVGVLWPLWVFWVKRRELEKNIQTKKIVAIGFFAAFVLNSFWKPKKEISWSLSLGTILNPSFLERNFYHFWRSIGRGTWNLLFPFELSPFYNELSFYNFWGIALFFGLLGAGLWFYKNKLNSSEKEDWRNITLFALVLFLPQGLIFISYGFLSWADRYTLVVLPSCVVLLGLALTKLKLDEKANYLLFFIFVISLSAQSIYSHERAPLWASWEGLLDDCVKKEKAPACIIKSIDVDIDRVGCSSKKELFEMGRKLWNSPNLPYAIQFKQEFPFYDSLCTALNATLTPEEKLEEVSKLQASYPAVGEISPALTLIYLQNKDLEKAFESTLNYSLSEDPMKLKTSKTVVTFIRGQASALCRILNLKEDKNAAECERRRLLLESFAKEDYYDEATGQWAYRLAFALFGSNPKLISNP